MGHLNGILARVGGNLNNNFQKSQMPGGLPGRGMLKLRFDQYITSTLTQGSSSVKSNLENNGKGRDTTGLFAYALRLH